ncbi:GDP-D-glucose phosphorylase 1 isoform X1 [Epinephelus moara]|uniref:GDP-D-glucose phosphorylase 1 isoform X1 n=3 Tax=Epinephelus moara TaxID=300413 RepID=UPI00214F5549|nr:GDP-D-glucose phosphorylase 1 isoform X1 [Epinephelus moara]XP_049929113.1 GDP-D-glucose phosphorylase 1 isoform X1 [Epinephelus moara]XP_049929114.1 GDP-D-glucose phosphorylase 1 isoform X1 [Epinephelus moara]
MTSKRPAIVNPIVKPHASVPHCSPADPTMPLQFVYSNRDFVTDVHRSSKSRLGVESPPTKFDTTIQSGWTDRMNRGLFRYHLGDLQKRILPGPHGYVAQLNIQRGIERRKPQEILSIQQEFSAKQFNFNKINPEEIIFEMIKDAEGGHEKGQVHQPCRMVVLVNVSPLEFGHCLFVPDPSRCFPQVVTRFALQGGIESVLLSSDPGFRVGFNSLGAFASVNHLHLHGYYLDHELKLESMPVKPLVPEKGFYHLLDFPAGFLFYTESEGVEKVAGAICQVTDFLVDRNIAHNLFLTRGCPPCDRMQNEKDHSSRKGVRIAVWPRASCFGAKEESAFNVALCELAGHLPFKNKKDYELTSERDVIGIIQQYLLPDAEFHTLEQQLTRHLLDL